MTNPDRNTLRPLVRGAYDLQKLRIQTGLRVVANFKAKLGHKPGEKEEKMDRFAKELIKTLRLQYRRITDATIAEPLAFDPDAGKLISNETEKALVGQYVRLDDAERAHFKDIGKLLETFPIYTGYLASIKGIGPAMAGVIISELDPHKGKYPSSFWRFAGLDVVCEWALDGVEYLDDTLPVDLEVPPQRPLVPSDVKKTVTFDSDATRLHVLFEKNGSRAVGVYRMESSGGRSRKAEHLVEWKYTDKNGKPAVRKGISFNPFLKTKLVGVLGPLFVKQKDGHYRQVYLDYKHRLENHPAHKEKSKGHRNNMALRYVVKMFLIDLHMKWRAMEGLEVFRSYEESKLAG